jgi:glycosyltransferase involved in cell wall biosynthesis
MAPQVTIVVPTYNAPPSIEEALRSVVSQTFSDFACVIVDDGSTDDTAERVTALIVDDERFGMVRQTNAGTSSARNRGAVETCSDLLAFFDQDDRWDPRFLATLVSALENPSIPAAHCVAQGINAEGDMQGDFVDWSRRRQQAHHGSLVPAPEGPTTFKSLVTAPCIVSPGAGLIRRKSFDQVRGFDRSIRMCEDWDLWIRLARLGDLAFVNEVLFFYRQHGKNAHIHDSTARRNVARVRRRSIADPRNSAEQRLYARRASRTFYFNQGSDLLKESGLKRRVHGLVRIAYSASF